MSPRLNEDGFRVRPTKVGPGDCSFYEGKTGLTVSFVAEGTLQSIVGIVELPWSKLKGAIERHQNFERAKARKRRANHGAGR